MWRQRGRWRPLAPLFPRSVSKALPTASRFRRRRCAFLPEQKGSERRTERPFGQKQESASLAQGFLGGEGQPRVLLMTLRQLWLGRTGRRPPRLGGLRPGTQQRWARRRRPLLLLPLLGSCSRCRGKRFKDGAWPQPEGWALGRHARGGGEQGTGGTAGLWGTSPGTVSWCPTFHFWPCWQGSLSPGECRGCPAWQLFGSCLPQRRVPGRRGPLRAPPDAPVLPVPGVARLRVSGGEGGDGPKPHLKCLF